MTYSCLTLFVCACFCSQGYSLPAKRDSSPAPSSSLVCSSVYHGQCIDTYRFQCMGIAIPGICGNSTTNHFSSIDFGGALTAIQCCNGWSMPEVGKENGGNNGYPAGR